MTSRRTTAITPEMVDQNLSEQVIVSEADAEMMPVLDAVNRIVLNSKDSMLRPLFFERNDSVLNQIASKLEISKDEALLLSVGTEYPQGFDFTDVSNFFHCTCARAMKYYDALEHMRKIGLLKQVSRNNRTCYCLTNAALKAARNDAKFVAPKAAEPKKLDKNSFMDKFRNLIHEIFNLKGVKAKESFVKVRAMMDEYKHLDFVQALDSLQLNEIDFYAMAALCVDLVRTASDSISLLFITQFQPTGASIVEFLEGYRNGTNRLLKEGLVTYHYNPKLEYPERLSITPKACDLLLKDYHVSHLVEQDGEIKGICKCDSITPKQLFYNASEGTQIAELTSLFTQERFKEVQSRLKEANMRPGFACLFYGAPGTGKTATVYQLAKATGRDVMEVKVDDFKSKWVGDSEKNIRAIFDDYRKLVSESEVAPILLLNEADSVLGSRIEDCGRSVEKSYNAVQDIILEEMENLEGILIATTNLEKTLDGAQERRFLYKVKFEKPDQQVRADIWKSMLPSLTEEQAKQLSARFEFSGGEIENVARKQLVNQILTGNMLDFDKVLESCSQENINGLNRAKVGF